MNLDPWMNHNERGILLKEEDRGSNMWLLLSLFFLDTVVPNTIKNKTNRWLFDFNKEMHLPLEPRAYYS